MRCVSIVFVLAVFLTVTLYGQSGSINNTLGTGGSFNIKDGTPATFLSLSQASGLLTLNYSLSLPNTTSSSIGVIYKGSDRFIHNYSSGSNYGENTFVGINAGNFTMSGTTNQGSFNTAVGSASFSANTTGGNNSAFGMQSLPGNTSGSYNSAFGVQSMYSNTTGDYNAAFGEKSLIGNSTGSYNSAFGYYSLQGNQTGNNNSAFGYNSLFYVTGSDNSAFGVGAGTGVTSGSNNMTLGNDAQVPNGASSNQIRLGNTAITYAGVQVAWTITSDKNLKSDIHGSELGLGFISKLRPVSYIRSNDVNRKLEFGFIAQEVENTLAEFSIDNTGMLSVDTDGMYSLRYNDLIAPMVKAIQELKVENERISLQNNERITALENQNNKLLAENLKLQQDMANIYAAIKEQIQNEIKSAITKSSDPEDKAKLVVNDNK